MKTISGKVKSSKPISLSRAAKTLSKFASSETGVSDAVSACLRRTADAFNELVQLHKELKASKSRRSFSELESELKTEDFGSEVSVKKEKKKQRREDDEVSNGGVWESEMKANDNGEESEIEKKRKKKEKESRENHEVSNGGVWGSEVKAIDVGEETEKVKKKHKERKEKAEEGEDGERMKGEEKREKKKRKNMDVQENGIEDSGGKA